MENRPTSAGADASQVGPATPVAPEAGTDDARPSVGTVRETKEADTVAGKEEDAGQPSEVGGPAGPEPTRFGDWERKGRCIDF